MPLWRGSQAQRQIYLFTFTLKVIDKWVKRALLAFGHHMIQKRNLI
jgi:hypothetical protein